jgi:hypothetical protein
MKRLGIITIWGVIVLAGLCTLLAKVGAGFYQPVPVDNEPLVNSIAVTCISSNRLILADGRVLVTWDRGSECLNQAVQNSGRQVEVESLDSRSAIVYVRRERFICGTFAPRIVIPLFQSKYPKYERFLLTMAEVQ